MVAHSDHFFAIGMGAGGEEGVGGHIVSVFSEENPVRHRDQVNHVFGELHHHRGGVIGRIGQGLLGRRRIIHRLVIVAEDHGAVAAHIIDEFIPVYVGIAASFRPGGVVGE